MQKLTTGVKQCLFNVKGNNLKKSELIFVNDSLVTYQIWDFRF